MSMFTHPQQGKSSKLTAELRTEAGKWIASLRGLTGLSQLGLSDRTRQPNSTIVSQIEVGRGRIPTAQIGLWAHALEQNPSAFATSLLRFYDPDTFRLIFGEADGEALGETARRVKMSLLQERTEDESYAPDLCQGDLEIDVAEIKELRRKGGLWLKSLRIAARLSQREVAASLKLTTHAIVSQLEAGKGRISSTKSEEWAILLNVSPNLFAAQAMYYYDPVYFRIIFNDNREQQ